MVRAATGRSACWVLILHGLDLCKAACVYQGPKTGVEDWSCPAGYRMPTTTEYNAVAPCVPGTFSTTAYELGVAWGDPPGLQHEAVRTATPHSALTAA